MWRLSSSSFLSTCEVEKRGCPQSGPGLWGLLVVRYGAREWIFSSCKANRSLRIFVPMVCLASTEL